MAEEDTVGTTQSAYVPGRALTADQYSGGFVDFYKDYLGSTGVNVGDDDDDDDDDDKQKYVAPNIMNVGGGDSDGGNTLNLLSIPLGSNETFYDSKVSAVDLQSMDLGSKSWEDYKKGKGLADKSDFKRNASITGGGLALAGMSGAMIGSAVLGKPTQTPWGTENLGAGMFAAIGNQAASMKYEALKEIQTLAATEDYEFTDIDGTSYSKGDGGYAIKVDGTTLVRSPGNSQYIGTLPMGASNQQILNLEAIQKGFLPASNGISNEEGFGVTGLGGYTATGAFRDANGNTAAYGSMAALQSLAKTDFNGDIKKAEQWLSEVRKDRSIFDFSPHMSVKEAQAIKDRINGTSSGDVSTTTTATNKPFGKDENRMGRGTYTPMGMPTDTVYDIDTRSPDSRLDSRFSDFAPTKTTTVFDIDTRFSPSIDDTEFTGVTSGRAKEALRDAADRSARMQELERQDKKSSQFGTFTESDFQPRDMSEGSQTSDEVVVDDRPEDEKGQKNQDYSMTFADDAASSDTGGGDKIVCTAMNNAYGFGSFRQTIWLKHSRNLDPAYQIGYHKLFRPLIKYAYTEDSLPNRIVKKWLEGVAKRRTADIWLQQRGNKRHLGGRIERAILEPICYIVGKL
jgi:hypothetical protein